MVYSIDFIVVITVSVAIIKSFTIVATKAYLTVIEEHHCLVF